MRALLLSLLSLVSLAACGGSPTSPANTREAPSQEAPSAETTSGCVERYDVTTTAGTSFEEVEESATVAWPQAGVRFDARVERVGDGLHITGVLSNTNDAPVSVDFLTGGVMGISTNPFQVDIDSAPATAIGPEVHPAPRRVRLGPQGRVTYSVLRCPPFPAHVRWTFSPWGGPAVQGEAMFR